MPSSYSALTRLEEMATGEDDGTWGTKTNTNLDLIDQSAHGLSSIALVATTYTLSVNNGSTDEARKRILVFTGSPGGTCTVTAPAVQHQYFVINNTDQSVLIKPSGGTGFTVPTGFRASLYTDGSTMFLAANYMNSGKLDGVTIGATTPATGAFTTLSTSGAAIFNAITNTGAVTTTDINGGTIDGVTIGGAVPGQATFSSALVTGLLALNTLNVAGAINFTLSSFTMNSLTMGTNGVGNRTVSSSVPSGGSNGDIWLVV